MDDMDSLMTGTPGSRLPSGTVALWFADLEGSTRLLERIGDRYQEVLQDFRGILSRCVGEFHGQIVDSEGDGVFAVFAKTSDAVEAAAETQRALASHPWPDRSRVAARIGVHTGEPQLTSIGYVGLDVHRAARITAIGHGGQVLMSETVAGLVRRSLPSDLELKDLGSHRLRDLSRVEAISQLVIRGLDQEFPPLRSDAVDGGNIPQPTTAIVGRTTELEALEALVSQNDINLVTVTGPGGVGKTRLVIELGHRLRGRFADGIFFIDHASGIERTSFFERIGDTLRIEGADLSAFTEFFRPRQTLLLIDNAEELEAHIAELGPLLEQCPTLKMVLTSRRPLRVRGEHQFLLDPLPVPSRDAGFKAIADSPSTSLFLSRAQAVTPKLTITAANAADIAEVARRLDGLPLAIELAAARAKVFSPKELVTHLDHPLDLLTRGPRDLPVRQRTLRDAIRWSYVMLSEREQLLLASLAVFRGGATLPMLESMFIDLDSTDGLSVVDMLEALLDHSLAYTIDTGAPEPRYAMLDTIREFCLEEMDKSGLTPRLRQCHLSLFQNLVAESTSAGRQSIRLAREADNLRAALEFSFRHPESVVSGLELAASLTEFWWVKDPAEGLSLIQRGLAMASEVGADVRAKALASAATLAFYTRKLNEVRSFAQQAVEICPSDDWRTRASALGRLALALSENDEHEPARRAIEESVSLLREAGAHWQLAIACGDSGFVALRRGDLNEAESRWSEAVELFRELGSDSLIASPIIGLGELAIKKRDFVSARKRLDESLMYSRDAGQTPATAWALANLGRLSEAEGNPQEAVLFYRESLALAKELTSPGVATFGLAGASHWCLFHGKCEEAALLLGAIEAVSATTAHRVTFWWEECKKIETGLRRAMSNEEFERLRDLGSSLSSTDAVNKALEVLPNG